MFTPEQITENLGPGGKWNPQNRLEKMNKEEGEALLQGPQLRARYACSPYPSDDECMPLP